MSSMSNSSNIITKDEEDLLQYWRDILCCPQKHRFPYSHFHCIEGCNFGTKAFDKMIDKCGFSVDAMPRTESEMSSILERNGK